VKTSELDYELPEELIATSPVEPRDAAKLLVLNKKSGEISDSIFSDLPKILKRGDVLVLNQTKVFPARIFGTKETGGKVEVVFLAEKIPGVWEVIIGGKVSDGQEIIFTKEFSGKVKKDSTGIFVIVEKKREEVYKLLEKLGEMPLPPYMHRKAKDSDRLDYQTVFAKEVGSAAAPTAGLHFTEELLNRLKEIGVEIEYVTLHVGLGTFAPVKTDVLEEHPIHSEYIEIDGKTANNLSRAKEEGRRIIAVGTTVMRTLESGVSNGRLVPQKKETNLFIYPGYKFLFVDGLITNFHTPKSSLLALVFALAGKESVRAAYQHAISKKYRFFSYGDGMLII
jgi:S-adenosylmethionine:tRNA ribosyltransferase-isomerase